MVGNCRGRLFTCPGWYLFLLFAFDEGFHLFAADVIPELLGRSLEEVGRRAYDGPTKLAVQRDLGAADGVDPHAGRVGAVPDLELDLDVERHFAEGRAFHADVA